MSAPEPQPRIAVVGGGPCGTCAALFLARRGFLVDVYEKRPDPRKQQPQGLAGDGRGSGRAFGASSDAALRSVNLALSHRGQSALAAVGVLDAVMAASVPMPARAVHMAGSSTVRLDPYGEPGQAIHSVSRAAINAALLDACDHRTSGGVTLHFGASFKSLDEAGTLCMEVGGVTQTSTPALVIGADGAYSAVRGAMARWMRQDFARRFIRHGYKELRISPGVSTTTQGGGMASPDFALPSPHALHIWPRGAFMLIALPNPDKTFTATLYAPFEMFDAIDAAEKGSGSGGTEGGVVAFFARHFPDAVPVIPELATQWRTNPTSALVEVRCSPWASARGNALLLGDAAHATVPFYGQGCNAALEDALCLDEALDAAHGDLHAAVRAFSVARAPDGAALCSLSMANYASMSEHSTSTYHRAHAALERLLMRLLPRGYWATEYSLVAFSRTPYAEVQRRVAAQERTLSTVLTTLTLAASVAGVAAGAAMWVAARARNK